MPATAPPFERVSRVARELADILKESGRPDDVLSAFVSILAHEHQVDIRKVQTFAEQWAEACRPRTDAEIRAIYTRLRAEFKPEDAEKYLSNEPVVPFEQVLAELEEIQRQGDPRGA
jgi:hypothetical protein